MTHTDHGLTSKMLKLYVILLVVFTLYIYVNPIAKKPTLY